MALYHVKSQTVADGTATSLVRPSDWNSGHAQYFTFAGNTAGQSTASGTNIFFAGGNGVTLNMAQGAGAATISISAPTLSLYAGGNTAGTSSGTATPGNLAIAGVGGCSVAANDGTLYVSVNTALSASTVTAGANAYNVSGTFASNGITLSGQPNNVSLLGNTVGANTVAPSAGGTIYLSGGNNITLSGNGSTVIISAGAAGAAAYTAWSLQNRQLGASTTINSAGGQNSLWLCPVRVAAPVSASTILGAMISYSGTITSAATAQIGHTMQVGIWSQYTDPASTTRFGTWWTGGLSITCWNSGTSSNSYRISNSGGVTTSSSAGSNLLTASVMGMRNMIIPIGSTLPTGLFIFGIVNSTSSAGYSAHMSRVALVMDNPLSIGMGTFGQATNASIGYADGGTYGTTTGALPATVALSQIYGVNNVMPFFKVGAI
jgi:hypothetical protein